MVEAGIQRSFSAGELSESISARADLARRSKGLRSCLNGFISRSGAWLNESGTKFVAEVKDSTMVVDPCVVEFDAPETMIPFVFNALQAYALEFGLNYIRLHRHGEPVTVAPDAYSAATDYTQGDLVSSGGLDYYCVQDNGPASSVVAPGSDASVWYELPPVASYYTGTDTSILEIPTPFGAGEITKQNVRQSGDVLFIAHKLYSPHRLERLADLKWRLIVTRFRPNVASPSGLTLAASSGGNNNSVRILVTAVSKETGEESVAGHYTASTTSTITSAGDDDVLIAAATHGLVTGDRIYVSVVTPTGVQNTVLKGALEERDFFVRRVDDNNFELQDTSGIPYDVSHTLTWHRTSQLYALTTGPGRSHIFTVNEQEDAAFYNWYANQLAVDPGIYGFLESTVKPALTYNGQSPDFETAPPFYAMEFERDERHPHTLDFVQQRLVYARSNTFPRRVYMSASANFENFLASSPPKDDDAIITTITGAEANEVRQVIGLGPELVVLTLATENSIKGDSDGIITPNGSTQRPSGYNGSSNVRPVVIGSTVVFIPREGNQVRSLGFDAVASGYVGGDLTIFASHLIDGQEIVDLAYERVPHSIVRAARRDGVMLGMTYIPEQEVVAWSRWTTRTLADSSRVLSFCVIPEDGVSIMYMVVEREIGGSTVRYVEKKMKRCMVWDV